MGAEAPADGAPDIGTDNLKRARQVGLDIIRQQARSSALRMAVMVALGLPLLWVRSPSPVDWMVLVIVTVGALGHLANTQRHIGHYREAGGHVDTPEGLRQGFARLVRRLGGAR